MGRRNASSEVKEHGSCCTTQQTVRKVQALVIVRTFRMRPKRVGFASEEQRRSNLRNYEKMWMISTCCAFVKTACALWERGQGNTHPVFATLYFHKVIFSTARIQPFIVKALFAILLVKANPSSPVFSGIMVSSFLIFLFFSFSSLILHFS